jgi:hypothetical protein
MTRYEGYDAGRTVGADALTEDTTPPSTEQPAAEATPLAGAHPRGALPQKDPSVESTDLSPRGKPPPPPPRPVAPPIPRTRSLTCGTTAPVCKTGRYVTAAPDILLVTANATTTRPPGTVIV